MNKPIAGSAHPNPRSRVIFALVSWFMLIAVAALAIGELKAPDPAAAMAPSTDFSAERALTLVAPIARAPHPLGSLANNAVREYLMSQLTLLGLNPQVIVAAGTRTGAGQVVIARTHDIVGQLPGTANTDSILLMAHYDSVPSGPGAADDAAGVAAILETMRALRIGPPLRNRVIVLFTDGEEAGLLGADAFAASNPLMKSIGLILNFEARGNRGPSLLFETNRGNQALIAGFAKAAPYPTGSSLFYSLYRLLPNDTDITVFRSRNIPAMNFAFGDDLDAYHSALDTTRNLSAASLQHHGSYALALTRYFGDRVLADLTKTKTDAVFFDCLGSYFVAYGQSWVLPDEIVTTILLILAFVLFARGSGARPGRIALAILPSLAILLGAPIVLGVAQWLISRTIAGHTIIGDSPANALLLLGLVFYGSAAGHLLLAVFRKSFTLLELSLGAATLACLLSWALALLLPAGSYLLFWPLLLITLGLVGAAFLGRGKPTNLLEMANIPGTVATILLFAPVAYLLYTFLTLQFVTAIAIGLLIGVLLLLCIPFTNFTLPQNAATPIILILVFGGFACTTAGIKLSVYTPQHPRHDSIVYSLNADSHTASWISFDNSVDLWTKQFFGNHPATPLKMPDFLYGLNRLVLSGQAPTFNLVPPAFEILSEAHDGSLRRIRLALRSVRNANTVILGFEQSAQVISVAFEGREIPMRPTTGSSVIFLLGMQDQDVAIDLTLKAPSPVSFWLADRSFGLPTGVKPRSDLFVATQASDATLVQIKGSL